MRIIVSAFLLCFLFMRVAEAVHPDPHLWTEAEAALLKSLWIGSLPPPPADVSNAHHGDHRAIALGRKLFFDSRLSANGAVSCATCHMPDRGFTDNLPLAHGVGFTTRRSMPLAGTAYSPWLFWDGRADSLWAQALDPIESPMEHGISRTRCALIVYKHYRSEYETLFGPMPEFTPDRYPPLARPAPHDRETQALWDAMTPEQRVDISRLYANLGKSIAAYVRTIQFGPSRFDRYVQSLDAGDRSVTESLLTQTEVLGLRLFIGKAQCINCHNGPLLTNNDFHAVGIPDPPNAPADRGRATAIPLVRDNEFNCLGPFSDALPGQCAELRFMDTNPVRYERAFKTPSLRNVADRPPYMHAGQFSTLRDVLIFYQNAAKNRADSPTIKAEIGHGTIADEEVGLIEAFLKTLSGPVVAAQ